MAGGHAAGFASVCVSVLALLSPPCLPAADGWQVPEASLRYTLDLERKPNFPSAGFYVHLPDGGILKGTAPTTVVMTGDGKVLPSYLLWHNAESGFSIVFADPGSAVNSVNVYVQTVGQPRLWNEESGLTPSAILCVSPGRDSLAVAQTLGKFGRVSPEVHERNKAGIKRAPLSIGGDDSGRPRPGSFYLLAYVNARTAGKYWIAPFTIEGQTKVSINGDELLPKARSNRWGGTGASIELTEGLHRLEVFQTAGGTGPYSSHRRDGGLMYLTWCPPGESQGAVDARVLHDGEIARSGSCKLTAVEARDGKPVAAATIEPGLTYWFENEDPLLIYELSALTAGQPAGTTYKWTLPEGAEIEGSKLQWIFPGFRESKVKLTAESAQGSSSCTYSLFGFGTQETSLDDPAHREAFRATLATMLKAYPRSPDPVADWSDAWWNNVLRTGEGGEGYALLDELFSNHFDAARRKLSPDQLITLQDLFLDQARDKDPAKALEWLKKFSAVAPISGLPALRLREGELQMYSLGDRKRAEEIFTAVAGTSGETGERAKIRLGDLAMISGDLNKATALYADVQSRAHARRNSATFSLSDIDRKRGALQEVSLSENARSLTEGGFISEARRALLDWEIEFPLSKISGDYIIQESSLHVAMKDWKRARPMLEAYCREIDASSFLPDAASMLIACVDGAKEPPSSIRDIIEKVRDRLKYHPVAADLDQFLSTAGKPSQ